MKPVLYSTGELADLISILEPMLEDRKLFKSFRKIILEEHSWLSPVVGPLSEENQFIHTSNHGRVRTELVTTPCQGNLPAEVLHVTLPAACISQNEEPLWGAFVPHQFYFVQKSEGCYELSSDIKIPYYEKAPRPDACA